MHLKTKPGPTVLLLVPSSTLLPTAPPSRRDVWKHTDVIIVQLGGGGRINYLRRQGSRTCLILDIICCMVWLWLVPSELTLNYECQSKGVGRKGH